MLAGDSLLGCGAGAKRSRLQCLRYIVESLSGEGASSGAAESQQREQQLSLLQHHVGEVMLCCKDSNARTRNEAAGVLLAMAEQARA